MEGELMTRKAKSFVRCRKSTFSFFPPGSSFMSSSLPNSYFLSPLSIRTMTSRVRRVRFMAFLR